MRNFLYFLSFLFFVDCFLLFCRKSITLGFWVMVALAVSFFLGAKYWNYIASLTSSGLGQCIKILFLCCLFLYITFVCYFISYGKTNADYDERAIIVLGCGLNSDGTPSYTLKNRLDGCVRYRKINTDCIIVLSGAKSRNCDMTEALGMKMYLLENGIDESRILLEERATNTRENFRFSKDLLEKNNVKDDKIVFVTNSFHVYRSELYAKAEGFENVKKISVKTDIVVYVPAVIRESRGVAAALLFKI